MKHYFKILFLYFLLLDSVAQTSVFIDAGGTAIIKKAGEEVYGKVYKRKNGVKTEWIWYSTKQDGKKIAKGGKLRGTSVYSSLGVAEVSIPTGFSLFQGVSNLLSFSIKDAFLNGIEYLTYDGLVDAEDKNYENSGYTNRAATLYALGMANGNKAYLNASGANAASLNQGTAAYTEAISTTFFPAGNYLFPATFQTLHIDDTGTMSFNSSATKNNVTLAMLFESSLLANKYTSFTDACNKNLQGSGISNVAKNIYWESPTIGKYVFLGNSSQDFRRLGSGFYYYQNDNSAVEIALNGSILGKQTCEVLTTGVFPNPPFSQDIAIVGWINYGADYDVLKNEISGGTTKYDFYGKNNGNAFPTGQRNGGGYETCSFPTHSITQADGYGGKISKCRYKILDEQGNVVMFVDDTRGGFHPNYGNNLRGNNHPDDSNRYLPTGTYTLEYANISDESVNMPQHLLFFYQDENNVSYQIDEIVNSGASVTRTFNVHGTGDTPNAFFKMNNNLTPQ